MKVHTPLLIIAFVLVVPVIPFLVEDAGGFNLPLFTPPMTGSCNPVTEKSCNSESRCASHGGYWYRLTDCSPQQCYPERHNDVLLMEPLLGIWKLSYRTRFHGPQQTRMLNFNEISASRLSTPENCATSDFYLIIEPDGCASNECVDGYVQVMSWQDKYAFQITLSDGLCCAFNSVSDTDISGLCSYSDCNNPVLPMTGQLQ